MTKRSLTLLCVLSLALTACGHMAPNAQGLSASGIKVMAARAGANYTVTNAINATNWARIERLTSTNANWPTEKARPEGRQTDPEVVKAFGSSVPPSHDVLLHYMKGWDTGHGVPVILVHGALLDATSNWIAPHGEEGLAPALAAQGRRVFAVTFAHRHGENMLQAEQLANAIDRIKQITGAPEVDVVAHSKGTVVARALASGVKLPWMAGYQHDIRKLLLIAGPNMGMDYSYRHPAVNYALFPENTSQSEIDGPMCWTKMLYLGVWMNTADQDMDQPNGGSFPGQAEMLAKFDKTYPLDQIEQDWYTTYYGGQGFASVSLGIDHAIATGGNFIDRLRQNPLDSKIQLAVLAGDNANLSTVLDENTGPSDSLVFLSSATATDDMTRNGATLLQKSVFHLNHMDLVIKSQAHTWVSSILDLGNTATAKQR